MSAKKQWALNFLVGCPQAGVPVIADLLSQHSKLCVTPPTCFMNKLVHEPHQDLERSHSFIWNSVRHNSFLKPLNVDQETVRNLFEQKTPSFKNLFLSYLFEFSKKQPSAEIVLETTAAHVLHLKSLLKWFPEAKVIAVVRDLRTIPQASGIYEDWLRSAAALSALPKDSKQFYFLRWEDFVQSPHKKLEELSLFLGLSPENLSMDIKQLCREKAPANSTLTAHQITAASLFLKQFGYKNLCCRPFSWRGLLTAAGEWSRWNVPASIKVGMKKVLRKNPKLYQADILPAKRIQRLLPQIMDHQNLAYPDGITTNCSVIPYKKGYFGFFKNGTINNYAHEIGVARPRPEAWLNEPYFVCFDDEFRVQTFTPFQTFLDGHEISHRDHLIEDARLVIHQEKIYACLVYIPNHEQTKAQVIFGRIDLDKKRIDCSPLNFDFAFGPQKNWVPFVWEGKLYIHFDIEPNIVVEVDGGTLRPVQIYKTHFSEARRECLGRRLSGSAGHIPYGEQLLGMAHSFLERENLRYYYHYFYLMDPRQKFKMTRISKPFKLFDSTRVQFAMSILEDKDGHDFIVSCGYADTDNYFLKVRRDDLSAMLSF